MSSTFRVPDSVISQIQRCSFQARCKIWESQIRPDSGLHWCTVRNLAAFFSVQFGQNTIFTRVKFNQTADFRNIRFNQVANFIDAKFQKNVLLGLAKFNGEANFNLAEFSQTADTKRNSTSLPS